MRATNSGVNLWVNIQHIKIYSHLSTGLMPTLAMSEIHLLSLVLSSLRVNPKTSYHLTGHQRSGIVKELKEKVWKNVLMHAKYHIFCNRSSWIVEYSNRSELTDTIQPLIMVKNQNLIGRYRLRIAADLAQRKRMTARRRRTLETSDRRV